MEWKKIVKAHVRKVRRRVVNESSTNPCQDETGVENLRELFERISLKDIPLEDRRREASKPLYLVRYE